MFLIYIVLYLNYIFENENITNITNVVLWIFVLLTFLAVMMNASSKDKTEQNSNKGVIEKTIGFIILFWCTYNNALFWRYFQGNYAFSFIYNIETNCFIQQKRRINILNLIEDALIGGRNGETTYIYNNPFMEQIYRDWRNNKQN